MKNKNIDGRKFQFDRGFANNPVEFSGINLYQLGELCCEAGYEVKPHTQWCHEISYIISGSGHFYCNNTPVKVCEGDIVISPLNQIHAIKADNNEYLRFAYMGFKFNDKADNEEYSLLKEFYNRPPSFHLKGKTDVMIAFVKCLEEFYNALACNKMMLNSYINQILIMVYRTSEAYQSLKYPSQNPENSVGQTVYSVVRYIEKNILELKNIQQLSKEMGYNYCYISHIFKDRVGVTLQQYINEKKIEKGMELLKVGKLSITQIASHLNYSNVQSFSRAFKRTVGISPTEYMESLKQDAVKE